MDYELGGVAACLLGSSSDAVEAHAQFLPTRFQCEVGVGALQEVYTTSRGQVPYEQNGAARVVSKNRCCIDILRERCSSLQPWGVQMQLASRFCRQYMGASKNRCPFTDPTRNYTILILGAPKKWDSVCMDTHIHISIYIYIYMYFSEGSKSRVQV